MKITLSLEKTVSDDLSIMVDVLRASTTITLALDRYDRIIPCFTPEEAFELKNKYGGVIAGERGGKKLEGFDVGNSPEAVRDFESDSKTLILTTSNGTRILKGMTSKVLVGSLVNAKAVAAKSRGLCESHIDVVMAGVNGEFALEDFLAAGEIICQITKTYGDYELSEYAKAAVLASRDYNSLKLNFMESKSGKRLTQLGYADDIRCCYRKNISDNVAIFKNNELLII